jgi:hypothetical protein
MSVRDLLIFNLFLQFSDGIVSYQAFALGAAEANPVVAAAIINWGMIWGLIYNKALACLPAGPDICAQTQPTLTGNPGIGRDGLGVHVRNYCLPLGTPAIKSLTSVYATCDAQNIDLGRCRWHTGRYPNCQNGLRLRLPVRERHVVLSRRPSSLWSGASAKGRS